MTETIQYQIEQLAPFCTLKLNTGITTYIKKDVEVELLMLLDTGATMCCIPESTIIEIEEELGTELPYKAIKVRGINGQVVARRMYQLEIVENNELQKQAVDFIAVPIRKGLIGRNMLNYYQCFLDGPNLRWGLLQKGFISVIINKLISITKKEFFNYQKNIE